MLDIDAELYQSVLPFFVFSGAISWFVSLSSIM